MKQAVIDIGSNSMRLTVYELEGKTFRTLFREKIMAGLAGYVENGFLSCEGILCACSGLLSFRRTLESLDIADTAVFATASLRNIRNTEEALTELAAATGYTVEVLSGEEEGLCGYAGAMEDLDIREGVFVDIGGASTELVSFSGGVAQQAVSYPVGSLQLYRECVKKILPGKGSAARIRAVIARTLCLEEENAQSRLACVGGTARTMLKVAKRVFSLPGSCRCVTAGQLDAICALLLRADREAVDLILRVAPERIHTLIPGILILQHITAQLEVSELLVSRYGVREGYLSRRILPQ